MQYNYDKSTLKCKSSSHWINCYCLIFFWESFVLCQWAQLTLLLLVLTDKGVFLRILRFILEIVLRCQELVSHRWHVFMVNWFRMLKNNSLGFHSVTIVQEGWQAQSSPWGPFLHKDEAVAEWQFWKNTHLHNSELSESNSFFQFCKQ